MLGARKRISAVFRTEDDPSSFQLLKETDSHLTDHTRSSNESNSSALNQFTFDGDVVSSKAYRNTMRKLMKRDRATKVTGPEEQLSSSLAVQKISQGANVPDGPLSSKSQMQTNIILNDPGPHRLLLKLDRTLTDSVEAGDSAGLANTMLEAIEVDIPSRWFPFSMRKAIETSQLNAVSELLNMGIELESVDGFSRTPLSYACSKGQLEVVELLLQKGANIETRNIIGETCLHEACYLQDAAMIAKLISWGAKIDSKDGRGDSPLHYACSLSEGPAASILISHGAAFSTRNFRGESPFQLAMLSANSTALRTFLSSPSIRPSITSNLEDHLSFMLKHIATEEQHIYDSTGFSPSMRATFHLHASTTLLAASIQCLVPLLELAPLDPLTHCRQILCRSVLLRAHLYPSDPTKSAPVSQSFKRLSKGKPTDRPPSMAAANLTRMDPLRAHPMTPWRMSLNYLISYLAASSPETIRARIVELHIPPLPQPSKLGGRPGLFRRKATRTIGETLSATRRPTYPLDGDTVRQMDVEKVKRSGAEKGGGGYSESYTEKGVYPAMGPGGIQVDVAVQVSVEAKRRSRSLPMGNVVGCAWENVEFDSVPEGMVGIVGRAI